MPLRNSQPQLEGMTGSMFIVCGEALMDMFASGRTPTGVALDARVGGSPFNVAVGLARLGRPVAFFGGVSRGFLGARLLQALQEEGVDTGWVELSDAPTTLGVVALDAAGVASYAFYGSRGADRQVPASALERLPATAGAFHFGSYAMVVEPVAGTQRALVEREHRRSLIAYDPNVRLDVEPSIERWRDTLAWMLPRTHVLKVSEEDLSQLHPGASIEALAAGWLAAGVRLAVVTRGEQGALGFSGGARVALGRQPVAVVDTVGAGDAFQAALLAWLAEHDRLTPDGARLDADALASALGFASRAAALTCGRRGADLPRRTDLEGPER